MKAKILAAATLAALSMGSAQAADVGVSISISEPGVYGRIDIGRFPQPQVIVAQPVIVHQPRVVHVSPVEPVYLYVPQDHRKHWGKHCRAYGACGVPVVFVRHDWYRGHVMHENERGHGKGKGKGKGKHKHDD